MDLRIGCAPDVPVQRLQAFLGLLFERRADLEPDVLHLPSAEQLWLLRDGALDIALVHEAPARDGIEAMPLYPGEPLHAFVAAGHRAASRDTATLETFAGETLLVVPRRSEPGVHDRIVQLAQRNGRPFRALREAPGPDPRDVLFAGAGGRGVALGPRSAPRAVGDIRDTVASLAFQPAASMPTTLLAWSAGTRPGLERLRSAARDVARELYAR
jgi:hypothetical protein